MAIQERNIMTAGSKADMSVHRSMEVTTLPPIKTASRAGGDNVSQEEYATNPRLSIEDSPSRNNKIRTKKKS